MKKLLLLSLLFTIGCQEQLPPPKGTFEPEFIEYITEFENYYKVKVNVSIQFTDDISGNTVGVCHIFTNNNPSNWIEIDKSYWEGLDYYGKQQLIYHELGHCVFGYGHDESFVNIDGYEIPKSIMHPYCFGFSWYYEEYLSYYLEELRP